ncbi:hypothetical protein BJ912DRAFT_985492 [Pholiota molesta]|nr:hypothetical protein BJ912DRAFT_985492 [Pholiota molesta]
MYESIVLVYANKFICGLSYEPTGMEVKGEEILKVSDVFKVYKNENDGTKDFVELSSVGAYTFQFGFLYVTCSHISGIHSMV